MIRRPRFLDTKANGDMLALMKLRARLRDGKLLHPFEALAYKSVHQSSCTGYMPPHRSSISNGTEMRRMLRMLNVIVIASLLFALAPSARAQTGEPSREPILRIETGMHTAGITRIGVDRLGKFLV